MLRTAVVRFLFSAILGLAMVFFAACGNTKTITQAPGESAPSITAAPVGISVPLGQSGTFTVAATGTAPLSYQWNRNDVPISGATESSYSTPDVIVNDSGTKYSVTVSNSAGSVTSADVTLTVGPRSPQPNDLRFQLVASPYAGTPPACSSCISSYVIPVMSQSFSNAIGTPLEIGSDHGQFLFMEYLAPSQTPSLSTSYRSDHMANLDQDITAINSGNTDNGLDGVISGLTLQPTTIGAFGVRWFSTPQSTGFQYAMQTVSPSNLSTYVAQQGAQSRVITAVSYDASGNVVVISYGLQGDATVYETKTVTVTFDTVASEAQALAAGGYIITAFGGGNDDLQGDPIYGMILVGTRVQGDTLPRQLQVVDSVTSLTLVNEGYISVGRFVNPNAPSSHMYIDEK